MRSSRHLTGNGRAIRAMTIVCLILSLTGSPVPAADQDTPALATQKEKRSYALGMVLGSQFREKSIEVDPDLYSRGLKDALAGGRTLLTDKEAQGIVTQLQIEMKRKQAVAATVPKGITVSFKLDPGITKGLYLGERWASPRTHIRVQEGKTCTVEARAGGIGAKGKPVKIRPRWIPADPKMVTVSPGEGSEVKITVQRDGQTKLMVVSPGVSKELSIKAAYQDNAIRVEISQ
jgi:FKBP-type peptidyl-prolyl isomerase-like protein